MENPTGESNRWRSQARFRPPPEAPVSRLRRSPPMPDCWPIANSTTRSASARWRATMLADARTGKNGRHALVGLLRQSVFGRLAGYEDVNDAERLRHDPAMRWIVGGKAASGCGGIAEPDGALRDALADGGEEPLGARRSFRPMDRPRSWPPSAAEASCSTWIRASARPMASRR